MNKLRFGAADYIAARPLTAGLQHKGASLSFEPASLLADSLDRGRYDAALIPSIEYLRGAGSFLVHGPALVSRTVAGSIILVSRKPLAEVERIAVDEFCRTPVAAVRIVLGELYKAYPDLLVEKRIAEDDWRDRYDAALLTADAAFREVSAPRSRDLTRHNIAQMWRSLTRTPLVHAVWVYNDPAHTGPVARALAASRDAGLSNLSALCEKISRERGIDAMGIHDHITRTWSYDLGDREMDGLRALNDFSCRYDLIRDSRLSVAAKA